MTDKPMTSSRPYLVRAIYEWIADNGLTPQIVVDARSDAVEVPRDFVRDGQIVLNIGARAVRGLRLGEERIEFHARFGGTPFQVVIPTQYVLAVVARENGAGMSFPEDDPPPSGGTDPEPTRARRPDLKVVK